MNLDNYSFFTVKVQGKYSFFMIHIIAGEIFVIISLNRQFSAVLWIDTSSLCKSEERASQLRIVSLELLTVCVVRILSNIKQAQHFLCSFSFDQSSESGLFNRSDLETNFQTAHPNTRKNQGPSIILIIFYYTFLMVAMYLCIYKDLFTNFILPFFFCLFSS